MKKAKLTLLLLCPIIGLFAQTKNIALFGSYNIGYGYIFPKVSSDLYYPEKDEVEKLRTGTTNQFEVGAFFHKFGLGFIHNGYSTDASTTFAGIDFNGDGIIEGGQLKDKLKLNFNGIELLYKFQPFNNKVDIIWKYAIGGQRYSLEKTIQLVQYSNSNINQVNQLQNAQISNLSVTQASFAGTIMTSQIGAEINYHILKILSFGAEISILPGKYKDLKSGDGYYTSEDNVSRVNAGVKVTVTL